jgi:hypothetical protein
VIPEEMVVVDVVTSVVEMVVVGVVVEMVAVMMVMAAVMVKICFSPFISINCARFCFFLNNYYFK